MKLNELLYNIDCEIINNRNIEVTQITFDSRDIHEGALFIAQSGVHVDGHNYIASAIEKGASAIVCQQLPADIKADVVYIKTENSSKVLGLMASTFYGNPSKKLKLIGITGTNGKTTTVTLLHKLFRQIGYNTGLISTIVNKINEKEIPSTHTTPDAVALNRLLSEMVDNSCEYCFMEVSSHSIVQARIAGLQFYGAIFSNITHDHLDFHKTFAEYIAAKKMFFDNLPTSAFALTNIDDRNGLVMLQNTKAKKYTYSIQEIADFNVKILENTFQGLLININGKDVWTRLVGRFNAYNLLAIYATTRLCGIDEMEALTQLSNLQAAEGRFEYVTGEGKTAIVDYAHTPDALKNVLQTINDIRLDNQKLITVVGCGGDRDSSKRPVMANIAANMSDTVILTSDNPRTEDPEKILNDMEEGLNNTLKEKTIRITNRQQAIKTACKLAQNGDIILVAGKGHEKYQDINGVKHHFDDKEELINILK
ncbi:MAG: UDP-N-acetylmuramoyl-L-alanyl-D-glutamate--2,6-diaminopimelate ligase [Bacteroidales bacterium]|nr:UDP-N-acetylmuramoyl-L-alanyl-D-glutamate--2,6-diaminopimelate ligase [Bacteroidales bacterium]MBR5832279.1 UDP-N-acetylmuramoyl-L-alanyl-D-glutamate--2,6-diaminopimelate ligase [Bacteroidales bacterium]